MFLLSKIISRFILPPGLFIVLMLICLFFIRKKNYSWLKRTVILATTLIYLLSISPVKDALVLPLENSYGPLTDTSDVSADYIVVLGGGIILNSPDENNSGSLTASSLKRLVHGAVLSRKHNIPIIVSGGKPLRDDDTQPESEVAMNTLLKLGIDKKMIFQENSSRNTFEQAIEISKHFAGKKIILVTSAYHMPRSMYSFKSMKIDAVPAPTDYRGSRSSNTLLGLIPNMEYLNASYTSLWEYTGFLYYILRY